MTAFYNENDPYAAQWLRNLIEAGHIAPGIVDERPIQEIEAWELAGFTQCHFFAGIGIWSHALRRAGWTDDQPIWTGSCPCQPFSNAGQRKGISDERHLWPFWFDLITQCKPAIVVGEQVASKDGLGWLDLVSADMEGTGYAFGASDLCAAGFQQAHLRQRLYFVGLADDDDARLEGRPGMPECPDQLFDGSSGLVSRLADPGRRGIRSERLGLGGSPSGLQGPSREQWVWVDGRDGRGLNRMADGRLDDSASARHLGPVEEPKSDSREEAWMRVSSERREVGGTPDPLRDPGQIAARWFDVDWLLCRNPAGEPSWRPVESGTFPLAHGVASRMGKLRAFGNALDAETATNFCETVKEICNGI